MLTPIALGTRLLRWGVTCVLSCALVFFVMEAGSVAVTGDLPCALAAKKKVVKKRGKVKALVRKLKGKHGANVKYPPLRDGNPNTALAVQTAPPAVPPPVAAPPASRFAAPPPPQKGTTLQTQKVNPKLKGKPLPPTDSEVLDQAQDLYVAGERQRAIDLALKVAEKNVSTSEQAWRFIGLAACSVRSHRMATRAYQNLQSPKDQKSITSACKVNGISYRDEQFVRD